MRERIKVYMKQNIKDLSLGSGRRTEWGMGMVGQGGWKKKQMTESHINRLSKEDNLQLLFLQAVAYFCSAVAYTPCGPFHPLPGFHLQANSVARKV